MSSKVEIKNKKAKFEYEFVESFTAGIQLFGTEIKSIRNSKASITESYAVMIKNELFIRNMYVGDYENSGHFNHESKRDRKLLLNKIELNKINKKLKNKGLTIVPTKLFIGKNGWAKLNISVAKGKKIYDKREDLKTKDIKREIDYLNKKLKLYESGHCPTCETKLDTEWHDNQKCEFEENIKTNMDSIKSLKTEMDVLSEKVTGARESKLELEGQISDHKVTMRGLKGELMKLKSTSGGKDFDHLRNLITEFEEKEATKSKSKDTLNGDYSFMEVVEQILGEDGVKNLAVKTILPGLNTNIAAMAQTMHLQFHIRFDEKFNCIINHLGEDINPMTLSTGERKKADFIIIIAIIKILKLRFPQLNMLFLDELLSSVDHDGVYNILKILNQVIKENKINTFVINHTVLPHEIFDKKIQIYRENGFSKLSIESIE